MRNCPDVATLNSLFGHRLFFVVVFFVFFCLFIFLGLFVFLSFCVLPFYLFVFHISARESWLLGWADYYGGWKSQLAVPLTGRPADPARLVPGNWRRQFLVKPYWASSPNSRSAGGGWVQASQTLRCHHVSYNPLLQARARTCISGSWTSWERTSVQASKQWVIEWQQQQQTN